MTMTPLAPRTPYIAVAAASFNTSIDSMSLGTIPLRLPLGPVSIDMPSITNSGTLRPVTDVAPLMRMTSPPSGERDTQTPGNLEASSSSIETLGVR